MDDKDVRNTLQSAGYLCALSRLTIKQLKILARGVRLKVGGKKEELIQRIFTYEDSQFIKQVLVELEKLKK